MKWPLVSRVNSKIYKYYLVQSVFFETSESFFIGCKIKFEKTEEKLNVQVGIKTSKII